MESSKAPAKHQKVYKIMVSAARGSVPRVQFVGRERVVLSPGGGSNPVEGWQADAQNTLLNFCLSSWSKHGMVTLFHSLVFGGETSLETTVMNENCHSHSDTLADRMGSTQWAFNTQLLILLSTLHRFCPLLGFKGTVHLLTFVWFN